MTLAPCPFCTHSNPAGARFCNECGSPLHLLPCEHCEAVNDALSRDCYRCGAPLRSEAHREPMGTPAYADVGDA
ncbi:MAG: zinc ribbon domain-containing protein, partial [Casimicrobiaceae bacterium]